MAQQTCPLMQAEDPLQLQIEVLCCLMQTSPAPQSLAALQLPAG